MRCALTLLVLAVVLAGCDTTEPSLHDPQPVLEAYLVGEARFPRVRLTETEDVEAVYDAEALGIQGAQVSIHRLDASGAVVETVAYEQGAIRGVYEAIGDARVEYQTAYRVEARLPDGRLVTGETFVPGSFDILRESGTSAVYQGGDQFEVDVTRSVSQGRQTYYVITLRSLEPGIENLTPFYLDAIYELKEDDAYDPDSLDASELDEFIETSSPPINEASFDVEPDGSVRLRLPWFAVVFYGQTRVTFNAIDDNINDFIRFQNAQAGGSTLSPGELPNILDNIEGGTGVFGSMARREIEINVLRGD